jgi:hypothetical protein
MSAYPQVSSHNLPPVLTSPTHPPPHIPSRNDLSLQPGHSGFSGVNPSPNIGGAPDSSARYANPPTNSGMPGAYDQVAPQPNAMPGGWASGEQNPHQSPNRPGPQGPPAQEFSPGAEPPGTPVGDLGEGNQRVIHLTDVPQLIELRQNQQYFLCEFILESSQPFSAAVCDQTQYESKQYSMREYPGATRGTANNLLTGHQKDYYLILKADKPATVTLTLNYAPSEVINTRLAELKNAAPPKKGFPWLLIIALAVVGYMGYRWWKSRIKGTKGVLAMAPAPPSSPVAALPPARARFEPISPSTNSTLRPLASLERATRGFSSLRPIGRSSASAQE